jgi:RHS repeat-associated protein
MTRQTISLVLCVLLCFTIISPAFAAVQSVPNQKKDTSNSTTDSSYIIKFKDSAKGQEALNKRKKKIGMFKHLSNSVTSTLSPSEVDDLKKDPNVIYIEKDYAVKKTGDTVTDNVYQIHVPEVQDLGITGAGVNVAILDTGMNINSTELHIAGGVSFVPGDTSITDNNGHGTFVAGVLAALKNDQGLVGVAPNVNLFDVKVLDGGGNGTYSQVIKGIEWAIDNHMDVISMSFAGTEYSAALEEIVKKAYDAGILLVAATGNDGANSVSYPAKFNSVIAVGAVDGGNNLASFSNTGSEVELVAPGVSVEGLSLINGQYTNATGTSIAVPQVAGVAALIKSKNPTFSNQDIRNVLNQSAVPLGETTKFGHGKVNAAKALGTTEVSYKSDTHQLTQSTDSLPVQIVSGSFTSSSVANSVYDSVYNSVYGSVHIADSTSFPTTYDPVALNNVNVKPDQAPFSIGSAGESISTLDGSVSITNTDLTLPGRGGLSFALTRTYNSSSSQFGDMDVVNKPIFDYRVYPYEDIVYDKTDSNGNFSYAGSYYRNNQILSGFYNRSYDQIANAQAFGDPIPHTQNFGDMSLNYTSGYYSCGPLTPDQFDGCNFSGTNYYEQNAGALRYSSPWYGPSYLGNTYKETVTLSAQEYTAQATFAPYQYIGNDGNVYNTTGYFNQWVEKKYDETMFPIGIGWSWNISSIESKHDKRYLHLEGKGTYEIDGNNQLLGYPWKDLTLTANSSVNVNGEISAYDLKSLNNLHQYFNNEGRLIEIADAYGNTIQFLYSSNSTYGKVLSSITDAIGNTISISYTTSNVVLTLGNKTITYNKSTLWGEEFLTSVKDQKDRITTYNYDSPDAHEDLLPDTALNHWMHNYYGLLTSIVYPTGATTYYIFESSPVTRSLGSSGYNQAYRIYQRYDTAWDSQTQTTQTYNNKTFTYTGDLGSSYNGSYTFTTTIDDGLKQTTYTNTKQYISDTVPAAYYTTSVVEKDKTSALQKNESMIYDTTRHLPVPNTTTVTFTNGASTSTPVTMNRTYDDYGNLTVETDPNNVTTNYNFDGATHLLSTVSQPINASQTQFVQYARNSQGSITQINVSDTNASGTLRSQTNFEYADGHGNITKVTIKDDNRDIVINKEYDATYANAFMTKQSVNVTDADGNTSTVVEQMQYDKETGKMSEYTDGNGNSISYMYDNLGRVITAFLPESSGVDVYYDDSHNYVKVVDETGYATDIRWNPLGLKISEGNESTRSITTYGYDSYGRLAWSQDALNHRTTYANDAWNRLTQTTYPDGSTSSISYDDIGQTKTVTDAEGNITRETYDLLGRTTKKEWVKASGPIPISSYLYDNVGDITQSTDGNNNITTYSYDVLKRLLSVKDAQNRTISYDYSLAGKLKQVQYADGNSEQKQYDELGRLIKKSDSTGIDEKYYYDADNNLVKYIDRKGQVQTLSYNSRNFLTDSSTASETISYTYDKAGRRLTMKDGSGPNPTTYSYNKDTKRLETVTYPDGKTLSYSYDDQGNRTQMTDPFGYTTAYDYDSRNRLTSVGAAVNNWDAIYTYKKNDLLSTISQGNNITSTFGYDGANLTSLAETNSGGTIINTFGYGYDNNFNQTSKTENGRSYSFTYDPLNRIHTSSQFDEQYNYDARGNRQTLQTGIGSIINMNGARYTYDDRNRLTQVNTSDGKNLSYRYNGDGLLYERTENGVTTRYYYDGSNLIAEGTVSGDNVTLKARYERGNGLVARIDAIGNKQYYMTNGHGDVVGLADANGNILNSYSYDMWGNPLTTSEQVQQPFRYSGEFYDSTTGLQYLRARWYDPSVGRFINEDTDEGQNNNPLTLNLYTYVGNNPLTRWDPSGHNWMDRLAGRLDALTDSITAGGWSIVANKIFGENTSDDYRDSYYNTAGYIAANADNLNALAPGDGSLLEASVGIMMLNRAATTGETVESVAATRIRQNQEVGNSFEVYVEGTKLKKLDSMGRIEYQQEHEVTGLDQNVVRPDFSIYDENDELLAIADAKTSSYIPYDDQAKGFIQVAQSSKSKTIIYYTPSGHADVSSNFTKAASNAGVTIQIVGVK